MSKFRKAQCPFCGRKVGLFSSWFLKTQGEYKCPKCGGFSNVKMDGATYLFAVLAIILSGIFFTFHFLFIKLTSWPLLGLVLLPFFLFEIFSLFLIRLRKPVMKRKPPDVGKNPQPARPPQPIERDNQTDNVDRTVDMSYFKKM
jgi:uncharacterized protein (DUF983 family)